MSRAYAGTDHVTLTPPEPQDFEGKGLAIVSFAYKPDLDEEGRLALACLRRFGGEHDRYLLVPQGMTPAFDVSDFRVRELAPDNLAGVETYNALMLSGFFYGLFRSYDAILIYQTDCLMLGGGFEPWVKAGWSYVGAPWFDRSGRPKSVGNGGFSLRRPADCLRVLESDRADLTGLTVPGLRHFAGLKHAGVLLGGLDRARKRDDGRPLAQRFLGDFARPEDEFWSHYAPVFDARWKLPAPMQACRFAAESFGPEVVRLNGGALPLGVHAWRRHDAEFWLDRLKALGIAAEG